MDKVKLHLLLNADNQINMIIPD